jgi:uncharacterized membrane protein
MTIHLTEQVDIDRPAHTVWGVVADYARDPEWRNGVVSMAPNPAGLVEVGTTTVEVMRFGGKTLRNDGEVLAVEPGSRFSWRTTSGAVANGSRRVEPLGNDRCRVHLELSVTPTGAERVLTPVFRRMLRRTLAGDAASLKRLAERATSSSTH